MDEKVLKMIYEKDSEMAKKPVKFVDEVYNIKKKGRELFKLNKI